MTTPVGNSAANASGNGPALRYNLIFLTLLFMLKNVLNMNTCTCFISLTKIITIFYLFNFGIKIYRILLKFLTPDWPLGCSNFCSSEFQGFHLSDLKERWGCSWFRL